jgi:hypothetical protein
VLSVQYIKKAFNNRKWRQLLKQISEKTYFKKLGLEVISPFGFEILNDKSFLEKELKRFYCYLGLPKKHEGLVDVETLVNKFTNEVMHMIEVNFPEYKDDFVLRIERNNFIKLRSNNYFCKRSDKLLDVQFRYFEESLIKDYADYIIASLSALIENKDEIKEFASNSRFRSRTYQLYVMVENIFGYLLPDFNGEEIFLYKSIFSKINNTVEIFYDESKLLVPASEADIHIMNHIIKPRVNSISKKIKRAEDNITIQTDSFHVDDKIQLQISYETYLKAQNKIVNSYTSFQ